MSTHLSAYYDVVMQKQRNTNREKERERKKERESYYFVLS